MENIAKNGGFDDSPELGPTVLLHWTRTLVDSDDVDPSRTIGAPQVQSPYKLELKSEWPGGLSGGVYQYVDTVPGHTYDMTLWVNGGGASPPAFNNNDLKLRLDIDDSGVFSIFKNFDPALYAAWTKWTGQFTAQAARVGIRLRPEPTDVGFPIQVAEWHVDAIDIPGLPEPEVLEGAHVTIGDVLDNAAFDAADFTAAYRTSARRWLNGVRSYIASQAFWKTAMNGEAQVEVSGNATGVYPLKDLATPTPQVYSFVAGSVLLDVTNNMPLTYIDLRELQGSDPDLNQTGNPWHWTDYGYNDLGQPLILVWPRPTTVLTVKGPMYRQYASLTENDDGLEVDPFFGPVSDWSAVFMEGLRYYQEQNEGEVGTNNQYNRWVGMVERRKRKNGIQITGGSRLRSLRPSLAFPPSAALADPGHYNNPEI